VHALPIHLQYAYTHHSIDWLDLLMLGEEPCDGRVGCCQDRGPVQQRRPGPGLQHGVQEDRHQRARLPDGPPQRRLPVRQLLMHGSDLSHQINRDAVIINEQ
jgi:hypothetical protein